MSRSPSTVFHFTKKEALLGILKENFKIQYCFERWTTHQSEDFAIPMVSFCDIKLSEIDHMFKYGNYGIGLVKSGQ
ncbi:MAG: hypothetical protein HN600_01875 [Bacteroidetes bacterium]|jgi:hypothetical protein|nr:hypothetical protein [Bacteroidota bacterium]